MQSLFFFRQIMTRCRKIISAISRKKTVDNKRLLETNLKRQLSIPDVLGIGKISQIFVRLSVKSKGIRNKPLCKTLVTTPQSNFLNQRKKPIRKDNEVFRIYLTRRGYYNLILIQGYQRNLLKLKVNMFSIIQINHFVEVRLR